MSDDTRDPAAERAAAVERWRATTRAKPVASAAERRDRFATSSDLEIADVYTAADLEAAGFDPDRDLGLPG